MAQLQPLTDPHQTHPAPAPWLWQLGTHEVTTLQAEAQTRWLQVAQGSVWLTQRESGADRADDIWLSAGQSLALPAGSAWVIEAWPQARVSLLQQAPAAQRVSPGQRLSGGWGALAALRLWWLRASLLAA